MMSRTRWAIVVLVPTAIASSTMATGASAARQPTAVRGARAPEAVPSTQPSAREWVRVWSYAHLDIAARSDGWVEIRANPSPLYVRGLHDYVPFHELYTPDQVLVWIREMEPWIAAGGSERSPTSLVHARIRSMSISLGRGPSRPEGWTIAAYACRSATNWVHRARAPLGLLIALDSASHAARAARGVPTPIDTAIVRDETSLPCGPDTSGRPFRMPVDPDRVRPNDPRPPVEVLARFTIRANGAVDTATLETEPVLQPAMRRTLAVGLARAGFRTGRLGGANVAQRVHRVIRFVNPHDPVDSVRFDPRANARRPQWMPRGDGLVEWTTRSLHDFREVSTATDVLRWLADIDTLRRRAAQPLDPRAPGLPTGRERYDASRSGPWLAMLGRREGARLGALFYRDSVTGAASAALMHGTCGERMAYYGSESRLADSTLRQAEQAARAALALHATPGIDTTRVHGELEVTCPARHAGEPYAEAVTLDSLRNALALPGEAAVSLVVGRTGVVDRGSIHIFGEWSSAQRARITAAVAALRFVPGQVGGYDVAQRSHLIIGRADLTGPGSLDPVRELCFGSDTRAVRMRALAPARGVPRRTLADIGEQLLALIGRASPTPPVGGTVRFVSTRERMLSFIRWVDPPPDTTEEVRTLRSLRYGGGERLTPQAYGIEAAFIERCP
jgi:hypothetical protein